MQSYGSKELDASLLMIPLVGFLPADDPRVRGTVEAIERDLMRDGFVARYDTAQRGRTACRRARGRSCPAPSGWPTTCTCWAATTTRARLFERLLALRNDVGLLSEEYDPQRERLVGNFPQAFSHVGLVNTAMNLSREGGPAEQRKES